VLELSIGQIEAELPWIQTALQTYSGTLDLVINEIHADPNVASISPRPDKDGEKQASKPKRLLIKQSNQQGGLSWTSIPKHGSVAKSLVFKSLASKSWKIKTFASRDCYPKNKSKRLLNDIKSASVNACTRR
jgi:hypothetical protein